PPGAGGAAHGAPRGGARARHGAGRRRAARGHGALRDLRLEPARRAGAHPGRQGDGAARRAAPHHLRGRRARGPPGAAPPAGHELRGRAGGRRRGASGGGRARLRPPRARMNLEDLKRLSLRVRRGMGDRPGDRRFPGRPEPAGIEIEAYGAYVAGDDLHHLDWNAVARLDTLLVTRFNAQRELVPVREFTRWVLTDVETGATHPIVLTPAARARYRELLAEHLGALAALAERSGAVYARLATDASVREFLSVELPRLGVLGRR